MDALDGNAIAGQLLELFDREMTTEKGACAYCGAPARIAELAVYLRAPGTVVRCRSCGRVVIVLVTVRQTTCVDLAGFALESIS
jgi:ribosomal protein L37E